MNVSSKDSCRELGERVDSQFSIFLFWRVFVLASTKFSSQGIQIPFNRIVTLHLRLTIDLKIIDLN